MNLLPIGSVVQMKNANRPMMIIGIAQSSEGKIFDYIGVPYPEGFLDKKNMFLFNSDRIERISFIGYVDSAAQAYRNDFEEALESKGIKLPVDSFVESTINNSKTD